MRPATYEKGTCTRNPSVCLWSYTTLIFVNSNSHDINLYHYLLQVVPLSQQVTYCHITNTSYRKRVCHKATPIKCLIWLSGFFNIDAGVCHMPVYNASTKELLVQHNNALYIGDLRVFNLPSKKTSGFQYHTGLYSATVCRHIYYSYTRVVHSGFAISHGISIISNNLTLQIVGSVLVHLILYMILYRNSINNNILVNFPNHMYMPVGYQKP